MSGPNAISIEKFSKLLGLPTAPAILDVRVEDDFALDPRLLPASLRMEHTAIATMADPPATCVIVCQKGAKLSQGAAALLRLRGASALSLEGGFEAWHAAGLPLVPQASLPKMTTGKSLWVTRHRPKIDRIACPWLIRRFVDRRAEFLFVSPEQVDAVAERFGATAFDMPNGLLSHEGDRCSFDKMLNVFGLETEALLHLARIVRAADTGNLQHEPEAAGLLAISLGLSRQFSDDLEQLEAGLAVYDALYRWCRDATDETHNWPAAKPPRP